MPSTPDAPTPGAGPPSAARGAPPAAAPRPAPATPEPGPLARAVAGRYGALAAGEGSLSCGPALDLARPAPGETVVDLGCGRGRDVLRAAAAVGPTGLAVGVDASEEMVARARGAVPPGTGHVRLVRADLADTGLPPGLADAVVSNCAINHARDKEAVFREVARLLRPGGRLVVSDVVSEGVLPEEVRSDPDAWAACYGGAVPEAEYRAAVERAGLREVEVLRRSEPYSRGGVLVRSVTLRGIR
jgi:SAM-dependent methyltransferase